MAQRRGRQQLSSGPWYGVNDTTDPFDDQPGWLVDATNGYIPDPRMPSGFYARPGFTLLNGGAPIYTSSSPFRAQGIYTHFALDGTPYNFVVIGGHLFRVDAAFTVFTDVTPVGVTIDASLSTRIKFVSLTGDLFVSDGVHRPWVASNLAATPITGTYIDFDGAGTDWAAQDMTPYSGALVVLLKQIDGVYAKTDIAWSAPGDGTVGYQQPTYDYRWTLEQTGSAPIFAIHGTNVGLYYWREQAIGLAVGALGPDFQTSHTDDAISFNVGTRAPQSIQAFGDKLFFTDSIGRPWMLPLGGVPQAIWQNMRAVIETSSIGFPALTAFTTTTAFESTFNIVLMGIWSPTPSGQAPVVELFAFDAPTGVYIGRWNVTSATGGGVAIECIGALFDNYGRSVLLVLGSKDAAPATGGYAWAFSTPLGTPEVLATEAGVLLTTEDARQLTTEGQDAVWTDNGVVPNVSATTPRLGYSDDTVWNVDQAIAITLSPAPISVAMTTPTTSNTIEGTPTPSPSNDGTYRCVVGADVQGRGVQVVISPTIAETQWSAQRVSVLAVPSLAGPEDP